jgi:N-acetylmuramoyl-L-alanine amidase
MFRPLHCRNQDNRGGPTAPAAVFLLLFILGGAGGVLGASDSGPEVLRIRHFTGPDYTRVVLDLSRPCSFEVQEVQEPRRLAVRVRKGSFRLDGSIPVGDGLVRRIRSTSGDDQAQVVIDLDRDFTFKSFSLPAADGRPDRVVVDVFRSAGKKRPAAPVPVIAENPAPEEERRQAEAPPAISPQRKTGKPFTVVIDPGHGGLDPGAIRGKGSQTIQEKDVVLDVSREMARIIDSLPGYQAVLTRKTDYYPSLGRRVEIARQKEGDLFISVHCNTHRKSSVAGMEVYFLSLQGATDREARELADKENAADLVGLDSRTHTDDMVMNILMDLKMSQVLHESSRLADHLLEAAERSDVVQSRKAKQARFQVLRNLAMPSALVEIAYLSNEGDRKVLRSAEGRVKIAETLVEGILSWQRDQEALARLGRQVPESWTRQYSVRRGDSLWDLAKRHNTTVVEITRRNNLNSRSIMVGQVLRLPEGVQSP